MKYIILGLFSLVVFLAACAKRSVEPYSPARWAELTGFELNPDAKLVWRDENRMSGALYWVFEADSLARPPNTLHGFKSFQLPLNNTVVYVEGLIGRPIANPKQALGYGWENHGYTYDATYVTTEEAEYLLVRRISPGG